MWAVTYDALSRKLTLYQNGNALVSAMTLSEVSNSTVYVGGVPTYRAQVDQVLVNGNVSNVTTMVYTGISNGIGQMAVLEGAIYPVPLEPEEINVIRTNMEQKYGISLVN